MRKKCSETSGIPTDSLCDGDGKPRHDNRNHAGARSHQQRSQIPLEIADEYGEYIRGRDQCPGLKGMKRW